MLESLESEKHYDYVLFRYLRRGLELPHYTESDE
jgi:hypothetical protein